MGFAILLLPCPFILELAYFHGTEATLHVPLSAVLFFGVAQAFAILPASLCFYLVGKHGVVEGFCISEPSQRFATRCCGHSFLGESWNAPSH
jgi:hypothetical protein